MSIKLFLTGCLIILLGSSSLFAQGWINYDLNDVTGINRIFTDKESDKLYLSGAEYKNFESTSFLGFIENGSLHSIPVHGIDVKKFMVVDACKHNSNDYFLFTYYDSIFGEWCHRVLKYNQDSCNFIGNEFLSPAWPWYNISPAYSIFSFKDTLYISGYYYYGNDNYTKALSYWNGDDWVHVESIEGKIANVEIQDSSLLICGNMNLKGDSTQIGYASWDGMVLNPIITNKSFYLFEHFNNELILVDWEMYPVYKLFKYNGTNLEQLNDFDGYPFYIMAEHHNKLYVGGCFRMAFSDAPSDHVMYLDESFEMHPIDKGVMGTVSGLFILENTLMIQGGFSDASGNYCKGFIGWDLTEPIHQIDKDSPFIYPNPAKNKLYIKTAEMDIGIEIFSLTGNSLFSSSIEHPGFEVSLDISVLSPGCYIMVIKSEEGVRTSMFVKK